MKRTTTTTILLLFFLLCSNLVLAQKETKIKDIFGMKFGMSSTKVEKFLKKEGVNYMKLIIDSTKNITALYCDFKTPLTAKGLTFFSSTFQFNKNKLVSGYFTGKNEDPIVVEYFETFRELFAQKCGAETTWGTKQRASWMDKKNKAYIFLNWSSISETESYVNITITTDKFDND